jgi:hypothetical protein
VLPVLSRARPQSPSNTRRRSLHHVSRPTFHVARARAFTLLEVMIACGIFFMATFAILALVAGTLRNARVLQQHQDVDAGMAAAQIFQIIKTNRNADVSGSGDFGEAYRNYSFDFQSQETISNGLLKVDIVVHKHGLRQPYDVLSIWVHAPDAKSGPGQLNLH